MRVRSSPGLTNESFKFPADGFLRSRRFSIDLMINFLNKRGPVFNSLTPESALTRYIRKNQKILLKSYYKIFNHFTYLKTIIIEWVFR